LCIQRVEEHWQQLHSLEKRTAIARGGKAAMLTLFVRLE